MASGSIIHIIIITILYERNLVLLSVDTIKIVGHAVFRRKVMAMEQNHKEDLSQYILPVIHSFKFQCPSPFSTFFVHHMDGLLRAHTC